MKKNYFSTLFAALMLFVAMPASAQVATMSNLYGKYKFSAKMEITEAGEAYASKFSNDCEVSIEKDPYNNYPGIVKGIAGLSGFQYINNFSKDDHTFLVNSPNTNMGAEGLYMSDITGSQGIFTVDRYGDVVYTFDPETKEITLPDFSLVTKNSDHSVENIVVKFTNAKLTPMESDKPETTVQWEGTYNVVGTISYTGKPEYEYPTEFKMVVEYDEANQKYFVTEFLGANIATENGYNAIELTPSADDPNTAGISVGAYLRTITRGSEYLCLKDYYLTDANAPITFTLQEDGTYIFGAFTISYMTFNEDWTQKHTTAAYYSTATATKNVDEDMETNVKNIVVENAVQGIFDLTGRKFEAITTPGLYIVNGKKVVVK